MAALAAGAIAAAVLPAGPASISVRGSAIDDCDDGEASCAAYQVGITVGTLP
jgi:hypothetical protein